MSLADLVTPHKKVNPSGYPKPLTAVEPSPSGMRAEVHWCEKHGCEYVRCVVPFGRGEAERTGSCSECVADEKIERQAREILKTRRAEVAKRIVVDDAQIALEVDEALAQARQGIEETVRARHQQRARYAAEQELLEEICAELRTKGEVNDGNDRK